MSLNAPATTAPPAVTQAARVRQQQGSAHGHGSNSTQNAGASFAQLLQGAVDDEPEAGHPTPSTPKAGDEHETAETGERQAEHEHDHRADAHKKARDPAEDATPANPHMPADVPQTPAELAASIRNASLLAAARAKLGAEAGGRGRHAAGLNDKMLPGQDDKAAGDVRGVAAFGSQLATTEAGQGVEIGGLKPMLDNTPVNLATASTAPIAAEPAAGAEFSLPSLGEAPAAPTPTPEAPPAQATLPQPPGSAAFPAALGAQLNTWLKDGVQYATLELNPQDMGPIDVRIALRDGRTEVQLGADVAATRAALTEALPELAEALGDVGLSLSGGSVSDQTGQHARQGEGQAQRGFTLPSWLAPARDDGATTAADSSGRRPQRGLIDLVA
jgi:flagellar hook-length control protein FliK